MGGRKGGRNVPLESTQTTERAHLTLSSVLDLIDTKPMFVLNTG